jgi:taurine dioxygenase
MLVSHELHPTTSAEISGVDLSKDIDRDTFQEIKAIWFKYGTVFFRNQELSPEQHIAFSEKFGKLETHVRTNVSRPGYPQILVVSNILENGTPIGSQDAGLFWHSDLCYKEVPSLGSLLYAKEVPHRDGKPLGDTMFVNTAAAYEALPDAMKKKLEGLKVVNSYLKAYVKERKSGNRPPLTEEQRKAVPDVIHPVVRRHSLTGQQCLFVNEGYSIRILDVPEDESAQVLQELCAHITKPEFVYRHQWKVGDLLMWDNCSTQHCAISDYALPERRRMERTTISGAGIH